MFEVTLEGLRTSLPAGFTVIEGLGKGGQGTVFRGTCDGIDAAIKVFSTDVDDRRVDREIALLSELESPHVVRLIRNTSTTLGGQTLRVLAYELHRGGDLTQHLVDGAPAMSVSELLKTGRQVAAGLDALWARRIVHRDVKPANIVRAADGRYVLVDVGFARHVDRSALTIAGSPGTRGYRSPEQARGRRSLTIHSDIFSLGVTLYVLAVRSHPFGGWDLVNPSPIDLRPLLTRSDMPPELVKMIGRMLDFTPANRPTDLATRLAFDGES